jgi:hypothetical protein
MQPYLKKIKDKVIFVLLLLWTAFNVYAYYYSFTYIELHTENNYNKGDYFVPFNFFVYPFNGFEQYDYSEFLFYVVLAWFSFILYQIIKIVEKKKLSIELANLDKEIFDSYVELAKEYIKEGINSSENFAKEIEEDESEIIRNAWDIANKNRLTVEPPLETFKQKLISKLKLMLSKSGFKKRVLISVLSIWSFIQTYFLIASHPDGEYNKQWIKMYYNPRERFVFFSSTDYDITEYFVYVGGAWFIYYLYRYLRYDKF